MYVLPWNPPQVVKLWTRLRLLSDCALDRRAELGRRVSHDDARRSKGSDLFLCRAAAARNDRTRVAHALAGRGGLAGDERRYRLGDVLLHKRRRMLLRRTADLAHQEDRLGLRVVLEQPEYV